MPVGRNLFTSFTITNSVSTPPVSVPVGQVDFIVIGVTVTAVTGAGATAQFIVQWSFDGAVWTDAGADPEDTIATLTAPGCRVKRIPVKATYWRVGAILSGTSPAFTVTGNALIW